MRWWKKFFSKEPEYAVVERDVPMSTILRWYLYDTAIGNENSIAELIGLTPVSAEGDAKEREDSENRLLHILPLFPYIESISDISANVMTTMHLKEMSESEEDVSNEILSDIESMKSVYKAVALSTLVGAMSIAVNLELIYPSAITSAEIEMENFDE